MQHFNLDENKDDNMYKCNEALGNYKNIWSSTEGFKKRAERKQNQSWNFIFFIVVD